MNGLNATRNPPEKLKECLIETKEDGTYNGLKEYYYTIKDGTKYYYSGNNYDENVDHCANSDTIFYITNEGERNSAGLVYANEGNRAAFTELYNQIMKNNTAYKYYEESKAFTQEIKSKLGGLSSSNIKKLNENENYEFETIDNIFSDSEEIYLQDSNSNFNRHRRDVIRYIITTNLSTAISGFGNYSSSDEEFIMPKISESDWDLLENNICVATFLQGMKVGGKTYNSYAVVPNNYNNEFVSENDIYVIKSDNTYTRVNDKTFNNSIADLKHLDYQPASSKNNFKIRKDILTGFYYNPMSYKEGESYSPYLESYVGLGGGDGLNSITTSDMYRYIRGKTQDSNGNYITVADSVKKAFYTALGRERYGSYKHLK